MECNRDEALRAREIAEKKFIAKDIAGAKKFALKAQALYPGLDGVSQMIATLDVHAAAEALVNGEKDWYAILCVTVSADEEMVKKQYRRLALLLHPDKNKSVGAEAAFKLVSEAWSVLSDKSRRMAYDLKRNVKVRQQRAPPCYSSQNSFRHSAKTAASNVKTQNGTAPPAPSVVPPTCPRKSPTFWTTCHNCKMQYEYLTIYVNLNLVCPNCHVSFLAVDTGNPTGDSNPSEPLGHRQQTINQPKTYFAHEKFSSSVPSMESTGQHRTNVGSYNKRNHYSSAFSKAAEAKTMAGSVPAFVDAATLFQQMHEKMRREEKFDDGTKENTIQREIHCQKRSVGEIPNAHDGFSGRATNVKYPVDAAIMFQQMHKKMRREGKFDGGTKENTIQGEIHCQKRSVREIPNTHDGFNGSATDVKVPITSRPERPFVKRKRDNSTSTYGADRSEKRTSVGYGGKNINLNTNTSKLEALSSIHGDLGKAKVSHRQMGSFRFEISQIEFRNMLIQKAKALIRKKLDECRIAATTKSAEKEAKQKQKQRENGKEKESAHLNGYANDELKTDKSKNHIAQASEEKLFTGDTFDGSSDKEDDGPVYIVVPDPEFHNFDNDRSESSFKFGNNQVWATYDDEDGMPRYYAMVQKVISMKPFRVRMSFLNSRTNSEFSSLNWVGMGFAKTCGLFRIGKHESCNRINMFSHKVKVQNIKGVIRVVPQRSDIWALYRNWSLQWNEHTPDDVIYKYDMVEVLDDYNEEQGVSVIPLLKRTGFKAVFYRHPDPKEVRMIPREEMFRFSHQVPYYLLTGEESQNAPKGCYELDPAAMPLELIQVVAEAKDEGLAQSPDDNLKI